MSREPRDLRHSEVNREIREHYSELFAKHGDSHLTAQWRDRRTQEMRFQVLIGLGISADSKILDFGCGLGDLLAYLRRETGFRGEYVGYELSPAILQEARRKYGDDRRARFEERDIFIDPPEETFDYALVSGPFNTKFADSESYLYRALRILFGAVRKGLSFNLMSAYVDTFDPTLFYTDPEAVFRFCKEELSPAVTLRHDYMLKENVVPYEYNVYVHRVGISPRLKKSLAV